MNFFADILPAPPRPKRRLPKARFTIHVRYKGGRNSTQESTKKDCLNEFRCLVEDDGHMKNLLEYAVVERLGYKYDSNGTMQADSITLKQFIGGGE